MLECVTKYMKRKRKRDMFISSTMTGVETDLNFSDFYIAINTVCNGLIGHCRHIHKHQTFTAEVTIGCVCMPAFVHVKSMSACLLSS